MSGTEVDSITPGLGAVQQFSCVLVRIHGLFGRSILVVS